MKKLFVMIAMISLQTFATTNENIQPLIIGGTEVQASDPIAQRTVLILGKIQRASFTCTGVIIADDMILTAGHCLGGGGYATLEIYFRTSKNGAGPMIKGVSQIRIHEQLPPTAPDWDDLAVVKLASKIPANYLPAEVLPDVSLLHDQGQVILAGYGITVAKSTGSHSDGLGVLRSVTQTVLNANYAQREFLVSIDKKGACSGDSGGPAFLQQNGQLYLVGITSRMTENDLISGSNPKKEYACLVDMIYSNVPKQMTWINDAIKELRK